MIDSLIKYTIASKIKELSEILCAYQQESGGQMDNIIVVFILTI